MTRLLEGESAPGTPERPTRFWSDQTMPGYWPPRPSRFWRPLLRWLQQRYARKKWMLDEVEYVGLAPVFARFQAGDGVIVAPNHSHEGDAHVMLEAAERVGRRFYFMVAWQAFRRRWGLDGWVLQRMGCFSVDRDGSDRRAVKQAIELLTTGNALVIFPEGEIHHLNERLLPLLDGVAFIAAQAQKKLGQTPDAARVWIAPVGIRYQLVGDILPQLHEAMQRLEKRMFWIKPRPQEPLHERIIRFGEFLLTIKEKEKLGRSGESDGDLPTRVANLIDALLARHEQEHLKRTPGAETIPLRVKALRRKLLDVGQDAATDEETCRRVLDALDDVQLALQLLSYPGNYIRENPTPERMAETIEKYEEDIFGVARSIGRRRAVVRWGEPIDMKAELETGRSRGVVAKVTDDLETSIQSLMRQSGVDRAASGP